MRSPAGPGQGIRGPGGPLGRKEPGRLGAWRGRGDGRPGKEPVLRWGRGGGTAHRGAGPLSSESLAPSSFHPVQRGRPPGLQACLQGQALGVQRKGAVRDFDTDSHWGTQPPAFGPLRDEHRDGACATRGARGLGEHASWACREALPGEGGQWTQGLGGWGELTQTHWQEQGPRQTGPAQA